MGKIREWAPHIRWLLADAAALVALAAFCATVTIWCAMFTRYL